MRRVSEALREAGPLRSGRSGRPGRPELATRSESGQILGSPVVERALDEGAANWSQARHRISSELEALAAAATAMAAAYSAADDDVARAASGRSLP